MLADSELGDRQLPDQCSGAPGQIQWSVTKCDVVGPSDGASPLAEGSRWPEGHGCGPWKHQREQCGQKCYVVYILRRSKVKATRPHIVLTRIVP